MRLRENQHRAKMAKIWIIISMVVSVLAIPYIFYLADFANKIADFTVTESDFQMLVILTVAYGAIGLGSFIGSAISFIQWFRRAYYNAHIAFSGLKYSEGWAAGAWFIPIFWWIGPIQIATEFYKKTEAKLREEEIITGRSQYPLVVWWWVFWVLSSILNQIDQDKFGVTLDTEMTFGIISSIASLLSGYFVLRFITNYSKMEQQLMNLDDNLSVVSDNPDLLD
ncbi:DUF4328 domain-containing protein [Crocinitomicaceae bacterium]|nr:DUF4328 domain-containing protein [Crocinitomicaceae bacterium]